MKSVYACVFPLLCWALLACSAVEIPEEQYYRLVLPQTPAVPLAETKAGSLGVVRVLGLDLAATLSADRLLVAEHPVQLRAFEFHRWVAPLPRMLADELCTGLRRAGAFAEVKTSLDGPGEDFELSGRILDCHAVGSPQGWQARLRLELRLRSTAEGQLRLQEEYVAAVPIPAAEPRALVEGLSRGLAQLIPELLRDCRTGRSLPQSKPPR